MRAGELLPQQLVKLDRLDGNGDCICMHQTTTAACYDAASYTWLVVMKSTCILHRELEATRVAILLPSLVTRLFQLTCYIEIV